MNSSLRASLPLLVVLGLVLSACSTLPPQEPDQAQRIRLYELKSKQLETESNWSLTGKLAISNAKDGGSGRFNWHNGPDSIRMDFHGALGRGAWRLEADGNGALLELADGSSHQAASVDQLVRDQLGWEIPVDSLSWWVRGMMAPGQPQERQFDERGNLVRLLQDGWSIEFGKYRSVGHVELPVRVTAEQADWKVKLVVRGWQLGSAQDFND